MKHTKSWFFIKVVSWVLVVTFTYQNVLLASYNSSDPWDEEGKRKLGQAGGYSPEAVIHDVNQAVVDNLNDVNKMAAESQALAFNLTTPGGDILNYVNGKLGSIKRNDGTVITAKNPLDGITLTNTGIASDVLIDLGSNSNIEYKDGKVLKYTTPQGVEISYDAQGRISSLIDQNKNITGFTYSPQEIVVKDQDREAHYTLDFKIKSSFSNNNLSTSYYTDGILSKIEYLDETIIFNQSVAEKTINQHKEDIITITPSSSHEDLPFLQATYFAKNNVLHSIKTVDSKTITFNSDGSINSIVDKDGKITNFEFQKDALFNFTESTIKGNGVTSIYGSRGRLNTLVLDNKTADVKDDITIHFKENSNAIDYLEKNDGTEIYGLPIYENNTNKIKDHQALAPDTNGIYSNVTIYSPNGEIRVYENGQLKSVRQQDNAFIEYENKGTLTQIDLKPIKLTTVDQLVYQFDYSKTNIVIATLKSVTTNDLAIAQMQYDKNFNLKKATRLNQDIIDYSNTGKIQKITPYRAQSQVFEYKTDGSYSVSTQDKSSVTLYDKDNHALETLVKKEDGSKLKVEYSYDKIRKIFSGDTLLFQYTYSQNNNVEHLKIEELSSAGKIVSEKHYEKELLLKSLDLETSVLSDYTYEGGKVKTITLTRLGKPLHTYNYSYNTKNNTNPNDDLTLVTDEEGVVRTYGRAFYDPDPTPSPEPSSNPAPSASPKLSSALPAFADNKLLSLTKPDQGALKTYTYKYHLNNLDEIVEESLASQTLSDNSKAIYQNGQLQRINLTNGSFITNVILDENRQLKSGWITYPDKTKKKFSSSQILEEISAGKHIYYEDNKIKKVQDPKLGLLEYSYEKDTQDNVSAVWIKSKNSTLKYDREGNLLGLKLEGTQESKSFYTYSQEKDTSGKLLSFSFDGDIGKVVFDPNGNILSTNFHTPNSGSFTAQDLSNQNHLFAFQDNAILSQDKFIGNNALSLDGQTDHLSTPDSTDWQIKEVFTIDTWVKFNSLKPDQTIVEQLDLGEYINANNSRVSLTWALEWTGSSLRFYQVAPLTSGAQLSDVQLNGYRPKPPQAAININIQNPWIPTLNTWHHLSLIKNGNQYQMFVDEHQIGSTQTDQSPLINLSGNLKIGNGFQGAMDEFKITNNSDTKLLLSFENNSEIKFKEQTNSLKNNIQKTLLNPHQDKTFFKDTQSLKEFVEPTQESILSNDTVTSQEYSSNGVLETQTKADDTVTLYDDNNKPYRVLDSKYNILMEYSYDNDGNPQRIYLKNARNTLPDEINKTKITIEDQKAKTLQDLIQKKDEVYNGIIKQASDNRVLIQSGLTTLQNQYNEVANTKVSGKKAKNQRGDYLNQITEEMSKARAQLTQISIDESEALLGVDKTVGDIKTKIEEDTRLALDKLAIQEADLKKQILLQETSPIIYDHYRRILGRDPSSTEYEHWVNELDYDSGNNPTDIVKTKDHVLLSQALKDFLLTLPELTQRKNDVVTLQQNIKHYLNEYLNYSNSAKLDFIGWVGLSEDETINLTSQDVNKILSNWTDEEGDPKTLHFGQSAFIALENLLDQNHITYNRLDLATKAILIDVLSGIITPIDDGDLVISMFALNKVAESYGLNLSGANVNWEDLRVILSGAKDPTTSEEILRQKAPQDDEKKHVIAHINGNHYVIITSITEDSITYIDPGIGEDKKNESLTVTKEGFLKVWQGNVTGDSVLLNAAKERQESQVKILSAQQSQKIRGAFWGSLLGMLGFVFNIIIPGSGIFFQIASLAASIAEGDWISGLSAVVTIGFGDLGKALGNIFKGAFQGITKTLGPLGNAIQSVGKAFTTVYQSVVGFVNSAINFLPGIGPALQGAAGTALHTTIGNQIVNMALSTGINIGVSKGLESMGVDIELSGFIGSLASGVVVGALQPTDAAKGISQATNIQRSVNTVTIVTNVGRLGTELNLDTSFTNIIGLSLAAIQGQAITNPKLPLADLFENIKPNFFSSLGQYGIEKFGDSMGIDSRLTNLIGAPITGMIDASASGKNILDSVNSGILRGAITLGVEFATKDLDPLTGVLTSRALIGAIAGGISKDHNIFKGIFDAYLNSTGNLLTLDGPGNDSWSQVIYLSKVNDFSNLIKDKGLAQALETYATSIFYRDSVEDIIKIGGTIKDYFQTALTNPQSLPENMRPQNTFYQGKEVIFIPTGEEDYIILSKDGKNVVAQMKNNRLSEGTFGVDQNNQWVLISGSTTEFSSEGIVSLKIHNGLLNEASFESYQGNTAYEIKGLNGSIQYSPKGELKNAIITDLGTGNSITIKDGLYQHQNTNIEVENLLAQDKPWYEQFNVSKVADFTDSKLDEISDFILGEAQDNMGWILSATALNSSKDILKAMTTDVLRFGEGASNALTNLEDAWDALKRGDFVSAAHYRMLAEGNILQDVGRALVIGSAIKGLATPVIRAVTSEVWQKNFLSLLRDERGFVQMPGSKKPSIWTPGEFDNPTKNLARHWKDHQKDFPGLLNEIEYAKVAHNFVDNPPVGTWIAKRPGGDLVYYNSELNKFAVADKTLVPRTYYKPTQGKIYGMKQIEEVGNVILKRGD